MIPQKIENLGTDLISVQASRIKNLGGRARHGTRFTTTTLNDIRSIKRKVSGVKRVGGMFDRRANANYKNIKKCRSCGSLDLKEAFSLGKISLACFGPQSEKPTKIPLSLLLCQNCHLLQLKETTNPHLIWNSEYGYFSGINKTMRQELREIALSAEKLINLKAGDTVLDIGCNDGTLLNSFRTEKIHRVGFDPCRNLIAAASRLLSKYGPKIPLFYGIFRKGILFQKIKEKAKVITAIAMFYDLDNPNQFLEDIYQCLDDRGIFIIQQNYLPEMIRRQALDNIVHEHLTYYSLLSLESLLNRHNLEIFDLKLNSINGGSFRIYVKKEEQKSRLKLKRRFWKRSKKKEKKNEFRPTQNIPTF